MDFDGKIIRDNPEAKILFKIIGEGKIDIDTGKSTSEIYIYGPEGTVDMKSNAEIYGSIIANKVILTAGAKMTFNKDSGEYRPNVDMGIYIQEIKTWSE